MFIKSLTYLIRSHILLAVFSFFFLYGLNFYYQGAFTYSLTISFGILGVYNFHRLWKFKKGRLPLEINSWTFYNRRSIWFFSVSMLISAMTLYLIFFSANFTQNIAAFICLTISIFYVKRVKSLSLREIPYMKVFFVIAIWFILFFVFPYMLFNAPQEWGIALMFLFVILIPSDIKDVFFDHQKMRTIPQVFGLNGSIRMIQIVVVTALLILICFRASVSHIEAWAAGFSYLLLLSFMFKKIGYKYFFVLVDFAFLLVGIISIYFK